MFFIFNFPFLCVFYEEIKKLKLRHYFFYYLFLLTFFGFLSVLVCDCVSWLLKNIVCVNCDNCKSGCLSLIDVQVQVPSVLQKPSGAEGTVCKIGHLQVKRATWIIAFIFLLELFSVRKGLKLRKEIMRILLSSNFGWIATLSSHCLHNPRWNSSV